MTEESRSTHLVVSSHRPVRFRKLGDSVVGSMYTQFNEVGLLAYISLRVVLPVAHETES